jgi:molecular chaperone GrpE (heat shock protein)
MNTQKETTQTPDVNELVNRVIEEMRPKVTELVINTIATGGTLPTGAEGNIPIPPLSPQDVKSTEVQQTSIAETPEFVEMTADVKAILAQINDFGHKDKIIKEMHEELQVYRNGLKKEFISPMLKHVMREYDRAAGQYAHYLNAAAQEPQSELFATLLNEFKYIADALLELLDNYGIVQVAVEPGSDYRQGEQKPVKTVDTGDETAHGKVARRILCGFRDIETERMLRQAEVEIYKFKQPL